MSAGFRRVFALLCVAGVAGLLALWWPTEARRITKLVEQLAQDVSFRTTEGNLLRLAKVQSATGRFTEDAVILFETLGIPEREAVGRDAIHAALLIAQGLPGGLDIRLTDVDVTLGPQPDEARVNLTASASSGRMEGFTAQEFLLHLVKREGKWLIRRVEAVKTLRR
jgi:hypothetical protein